MIKLTLSEVCEALRPAARGELPTLSIAAVSTDSRTAPAGALFFCLSGDRFDGHVFAADAARRGVAAVVVAESRADEVESAIRAAGGGLRTAVLAVDDPRAALGRLAAYHRRQHPATVIAVCGSNGKTTTKEMITHVLSGRMRGRCSPKSFNNNVGVPLTLLSAEPGDDFLVAEIGTNAPGEVAALSAMCSPDIAVLTCIGEEHLEGLGDLEGVAAEECSVLRHVRRGGFAAVNIDSPLVLPHLDAPGITRTTCGATPQADLRLTRTRYQAPWLDFEVNGRFHYRLHMPGEHNARNALLAVAVARRMGMDHLEIAERMKAFVPPPMRGEVVTIGGLRIINDAYNANPHSALAALCVLESVAEGGRRIVVFGEMRELGEQSPDAHRRVAARLREARLDHVVLVGRACELMYDELKDGDLFCPSVERCGDVAEAGTRLASLVRDGDAVLLKASRAVGLERVLDALRLARGAAAG